MIDLLFHFVLITGILLWIVWLGVYYAIALKCGSNQEYKAARSKASFIKAQPRTSLNLFSLYCYIEISIYGLLVFACVLLALQYGVRWLHLL